MTIQFKTDAVYTLNSLKLICTYIEDNTVWLKCVVRDNYSYPVSDTTLLYKYERKSNKLYVFNTKVQAWDSVEGSLSEEGMTSRIVLVRDDDKGRSWAYLEDGELPSHFEDAYGVKVAKVPGRFHEEVSKG